MQHPLTDDRPGAASLRPDRPRQETSRHGPTDGDAEVGREGAADGRHTPADVGDRPRHWDAAQGDHPVVGGALLWAFLGVAIAVALASTVDAVAEVVHPVLAGVIGAAVGALLGALWGRGAQDSGAHPR